MVRLMLRRVRVRIPKRLLNMLADERRQESLKQALHEKLMPAIVPFGQIVRQLVSHVTHPEYGDLREPNRR